VNGEVIGTLLRSEALGNFLLHFHHTAILFGLIVGEGNTRMVEEQHHILFTAIEAIEKIVTDPELFATAPFGCAFA